MLIALCRFAGLRNPSETGSLRWESVDWDKGRMTVLSPKTKRHENGESREVPIFSQLRPYLEEAWDQVSEGGSEFVIPRCRDNNSNQRTHMLRLIRRAGLKPWPKLFHNLRASLQTELEEKFPTHVVCSWLGNSPKIAREHYLLTTDDHFDRAIGDAGALHNALQQPAAKPRNKGKSKMPDGDETLELQGIAASCGSLRDAPEVLDKLEHIARQRMLP